MKKIISTYLIFVFMLMTFSGCERIKNSLGLSSANAEIPVNPKSDLGGPNNVKRARTIFFTTAAITLAAWVVGAGCAYKKIELPPVLDRSLFAIAVIGIPATIGTGIHAYKATVSESKKDSGSVANNDNGKNEEKDIQKR
jgi:hypothetical protein